VRESVDVVGANGLEPLRRAILACERSGVRGARVMCHIGNAPGELSALLDLLRPGDILTHAYSGAGNNTVRDGKVLAAALAAKKRGVLIDVGHGGGSFDYTVAEPAIAQGFTPDTIGSDIHAVSGNTPGMPYLPWVMSKFLNLGFSLEQVVAMATATPARIIGRMDKLGMLAIGAPADVSILELVEGPVDFVAHAQERAQGQSPSEGRSRRCARGVLSAGLTVAVQLSLTLAGRGLHGAEQEPSDPAQCEQARAPLERESRAQHRDGGSGGDDEVGPGAQARSPRQCRGRRRRSTLRQTSSPRRAPARCACASARSARAARESPRARSWSLEPRSVLAQLGERSRQELRPPRDRPARKPRQAAIPPTAKPPASTPIARRRSVSQNSTTRKKTSRITASPRQERGSRGEQRDSREPRPLLVDLAREDLDACLHDREKGPREISQRIEQALGAPGFFGHGKRQRRLIRSPSAIPASAAIPTACQGFART